MRDKKTGLIKSIGLGLSLWSNVKVLNMLWREFLEGKAAGVIYLKK
jgi:hypothetical protein